MPLSASWWSVLLVEETGVPGENHSSVSQEYFDWMTTFTKNLAGTVSIDDEEFRVGLLKDGATSGAGTPYQPFRSTRIHPRFYLWIALCNL
jgi:hypothetical protein